MRIRKKSNRRVGPPVDAKTGAAAILATAIKLYDRKDGHGADWRAVDEALFHAAFEVLDRLPDDQKRSLARNVHARAYDYTVGNESDAAAHDSNTTQRSPEKPGAVPDHMPR